MPLTRDPVHRPLRQQVVAAVALAASLAAALTLSACLPSVGRAPAALALLNPMTVDPGQLRAAVRLPDSARIVDGALTVTADLTGLAVPEVREFPLTVSHDPAERVALASEAKAGFAITVFRLDARQAADLAAWRKALIANRHGKVTLAIRADTCRVAGGPDDPVPLTVYIAASPTGGYAVLVAEADLARLTASNGGVPTLAPCGAS